jgi:hypothetical protein
MPINMRERGPDFYDQATLEVSPISETCRILTIRPRSRGPWYHSRPARRRARRCSHWAISARTAVATAADRLRVSQQATAAATGRDQQQRKDFQHDPCLCIWCRPPVLRLLGQLSMSPSRRKSPALGLAHDGEKGLISRPASGRNSPHVGRRGAAWASGGLRLHNHNLRHPRIEPAASLVEH